MFSSFKRRGAAAIEPLVDVSRRAGVDALRGLLLLLMALTHLPTRVSAYANQPLGFVSAAEGFIFLSAFLAGRSHPGRASVQNASSAPSAWRRLWGRALRLYGYHLLLLLFAFTIAAAFAALTGRPALRNLLTFYFDAPLVAIISGSLLLYQPPLFDILPMYIVFLLLTPLLLSHTSRNGWSKLLALSAIAWVFAQAGGRRLVYDAAGSFDLFAWQLLWVVGFWVGYRLGSEPAALRASAVAAAVAVSVAFLLWRHDIGGVWSGLDALAPALDKWRLGALRLLNFAALAIVVSRLVVPLLAWVHLSVLALLGRASLQVFAAHLVVCVASLGLLVDDDTPLTLVQEILVVVVAIAVMVFVAKLAVARTKTRLSLSDGPT